jgi:membrane protease YdiL (CAAX protease family)
MPTLIGFSGQVPDPLVGARVPAPSTAAEPGLCLHRAEFLLLAFLIVGAFVATPELATVLVNRAAPALRESGFKHVYGLFHLAYGLLLVAGAPRRNGLCLGNIRSSWKGVALVCGGPVLATAIIYPLLPTRPWGGQSIHMWLTSPLAQEAVFTGYIYGGLERLFPGRTWRGLPFTRALLLTSVYFAAYHVPSFLGLPGGYVAFQLCYTFVGCMIVGLARVWTGSILYGVLTHMAVNGIAWAFSPPA